MTGFLRDPLSHGWAGSLQCEQTSHHLDERTLTALRTGPGWRKDEHRAPACCHSLHGPGNRRQRCPEFSLTKGSGLNREKCCLSGPHPPMGGRVRRSKAGRLPHILREAACGPRPGSFLPRPPRQSCQRGAAGPPSHTPPQGRARPERGVPVTDWLADLEHASQTSGSLSPTWTRRRPLFSLQAWLPRQREVVWPGPPTCVLASRAALGSSLRNRAACHLRPQGHRTMWGKGRAAL